MAKFSALFSFWPRFHAAYIKSRPFTPLTCKFLLALYQKMISTINSIFAPSLMLVSKNERFFA